MSTCGDGPGEAGQPAREAEVVEHRRTQPADRGARLLQRQIHQLAGLLQLFGSASRRRRRRRGVAASSR